MAREKMVTRTILSTKATVMAVDIPNGETVNKTYDVSGTYKDDATLLKAVKKQYEVAGELAIVAVVDSQTVEALYGMKEVEFLQHAQLLPPRVKED